MRVCHFPACLITVTKTDRKMDLPSLGQRCKIISPVAERSRKMLNKKVASKRSDMNHENISKQRKNRKY